MSKALRVFVLFTTAYFLSYFFRTANAVIAPDLSRELGLGAAELGLMTSLFFGTFALTQFPLGVALDSVGPRWATPGLMLVAVVGSLVFATAQSFGTLALGRALIGVGMAGVLMGSMKAFSQWFPTERFATVAGLLVAFGSLGALTAATPLAWLNAQMGWRAAFVLGAVMVLAVAAAIMAGTRNTPEGVPWHGRRDGGGSLGTVLTDVRFWRLAPLTFFMTGSLYAYQGLWAGPYLYDVLGFGAMETGNTLLLLGVGAAAGFATSGWVAGRIGLSRAVLGGVALLAACQIALAVWRPTALVGGVFAVYGFSAAFHILLLAQVRQLYATAIGGRAMSALNFFAIGGVFVLQWWMGVIIGAFGVEGAGRYPPQAHMAALLFLTVGLILAAVWYWPLTQSVAERARARAVEVG